MKMGLIVLASARSDVGDYVSKLILVYIIILFLYILLNMMFSLGLRMPYSRWSNAVLSFLRDVSEPYLRIFRRIVPTVGMIDFSPWLAIIVLVIVQQIIPPLISG
jgi:YggT family protein